MEENVGRFDGSGSDFRNRSSFVGTLVESRSRGIRVGRVEIGLFGEFRVLEICRTGETLSHPRKGNKRKAGKYLQALHLSR